MKKTKLFFINNFIAKQTQVFLSTVLHNSNEFLCSSYTEIQAFEFQGQVIPPPNLWPPVLNSRFDTCLGFNFSNVSLTAKTR